MRTPSSGVATLADHPATTSAGRDTPYAESPTACRCLRDRAPLSMCRQSSFGGVVAQVEPVPRPGDTLAATTGDVPDRRVRHTAATATPGGGARQPRHQRENGDATGRREHRARDRRGGHRGSCRSVRRRWRRGHRAGCRPPPGPALRVPRATAARRPAARVRRRSSGPLSRRRARQRRGRDSRRRGRGPPERRCRRSCSTRGRRPRRAREPHPAA